VLGGQEWVSHKPNKSARAGFLRWGKAPPTGLRVLGAEGFRYLRRPDPFPPPHADAIIVLGKRVLFRAP